MPSPKSDDTPPERPRHPLAAKDQVHSEVVRTIHYYYKHIEWRDDHQLVLNHVLHATLAGRFSRLDKRPFLRAIRAQLGQLFGARLCNYGAHEMCRFLCDYIVLISLFFTRICYCRLFGPNRSFMKVCCMWIECCLHS